ncbi:M28 family peptidase [Sphingobacterium hotanense]|uniref:M28 family peptidase n=1 Tax=Sphingobacterium hotanense TaxID=649196 RepID=UPI0021A48E27|nr:M28 family peptidase [Sphingobacterium hotanense]MCT1525986.1 M28 family peptidase [Sphingobacterium hotanense]
MKRIYLISLLFLSQFAFAQEALKDNFEKIYQDINQHSEAYDRLKYSTEKIGHRLTGSKNGKKAETYVHDLLKSYGYQVSYQPFSAEAWSRKSLKLRFNKQEVPSVSLAHSPVRAKVEAELIDLGNGLEADYQRVGDKVKDKIALVFLHILPNSGQGLKNLHRSEKTALAEKYGAAGIIFINSVKGNVLLTGTASITGKLINIPAVCIGFEDGMKWKETLASQPILAAIEMKNKSGEATARNVLVHIPGTSLANEKIVIGGHLDSWDLATGAIDNGIGSFAVVDIARAFKKLALQNKRSIDLVLFMGEEQGLLGAKAYVDQAIKEGEIDQIKYMINLDMVNAPIGFTTTREEMKQLFDQWGAVYAEVDDRFKNENSIAAGLHSDHQPFMLQGIPTATGRGGALPNNAGMYYHSNRDVFGLVDKGGLEQTIRVSAALLYALANADQIPAIKLSDTAIKQFLEDKGMKEPLKISGEWRWGQD